MISDRKAIVAIDALLFYQGTATHQGQAHGQPATSLNRIKIKSEALAEGAGVAGTAAGWAGPAQTLRGHFNLVIPTLFPISRSVGAGCGGSDLALGTKLTQMTFFPFFFFYPPL